jgi:phospholipid/cholesterol/gamma-HCH transport system substrate-binding protein
VRSSRLIKIQLTVFVAVSVIALSVMAIGYLNVPTMLFGFGHYTVTVQLPEAAGLYKRANVTYLGAEVGRVEDVLLHDGGVQAVLSLKSDVAIPSNLQAQVHSTSAIGEQYVELLPHDATSPPLKNGDVIPAADTTIPADVNVLLDTTNRGLQAIPGDNLQTVIDESYTGIGGLGPEISRIVDASTTLAAGARHNLDALTALIDKSPAVLDSQTQTADSLHAWAAHLASITDQVRKQDDSVSTLLPTAARAAAEGQALFDRLQPTVPILLANLVSVANVAVTYHANIEQLLVLFPANIANVQATAVANQHQSRYNGALLQLNLNLNLPPPCNAGFLPPQQVRPPSLEDAPDRPAGDLYCRVPQDSPWNVRGARNIPCETKPWKRAPTVKMCESDDDYVPLNDGYNWKGDPNATLSGQDVPQTSTHVLPPPPPAPSGAAPPPIAIAEYDPATGNYVGPDGKVYTQANLAQNSSKEQTWQSMLMPPTATP